MLVGRDDVDAARLRKLGKVPVKTARHTGGAGHDDELLAVCRVMRGCQRVAIFCLKCDVFWCCQLRLASVVRHWFGWLRLK